MALHLLYEDDFSGHANQSAFEAAYPLDEPGDLSTSVINLDWGLTEGPGGVPGVSPSSGGVAGFFHARHLAAQGKLFRVEGRDDFSGANEYIFTLYWHLAGTGWPGGTRSYNIFQLQRIGVDLTAWVRTTSTDYIASAGTISIGTASDLRIDGKVSTLTEITAGVYAPSSDGFVRVYVDGVMTFEFIGPVWNGVDSMSGAAPYWNSVQVQPTGAFTNFKVYDERAAIRGSFVAGETGAVTANRAALFSLDGAVNTNDTEGLFKIAGDLEVTGTATIGGVAAISDLSAALDALGT